MGMSRLGSTPKNKVAVLSSTRKNRFEIVGRMSNIFSEVKMSYGNPTDESTQQNRI